MSAGAPPVSDVAIADGGSGDLDAVVEVMNGAFDERFGEGWTRSQCAGILPMPGVHMVVARCAQGGAAGFSLYRTLGPEAELLLLAVAPEFQRRGVGRTLLAHFLDNARHCGATKVHLEVRDGNPAVQMYRAAGFRFEGRRRKYYRGRFGGEFDALTLSRQI